MTTGLRIDLAPLINEWLWCSLALLAALSLLIHWICSRRARLLRTSLAALILLALLNPLWIRELREEKPDVVALAIDRSDSMNIGKRPELAQKTLAEIQKKLLDMPGIELRLLETPENARETEMFTHLRAALADTPREQIGASILITDGQIHDVPEPSGNNREFGPLHAIITGHSNLPDRRVEILAAPKFGVVGEQISLSIIVHDKTSTTAPIHLSVNGQAQASSTIKTGVKSTLTLSLPRRGNNLVLIETDAKPDEPTLVNNYTATYISGVRDRLRVLLVTGQPHAGGRVWRDLLKSDPAVDLVHFTILRPPYKASTTPTRELSLIAFPTRELFVERLPEFDLVILDQYKRRNVLSMSYFDNISRYVSDGGALLITTAPAFASSSSIYRTSMASVIPVRPTGKIVSKTFKPQPSDIGKRHTVTSTLPHHNKWGVWQRYVDSTQASGHTLLETENKTPLLVLDRVGKGRVATLMSDQLWLWARGHDGGGPYGELIRRLAHWLMREPELEEESLELSNTNSSILAHLRSLENQPPPLNLTAPDGQIFSPEWKEKKPGQWNAELKTEIHGIWKADAGKLHTLSLKGPHNPREYQNLDASDKLVSTIAKASSGGIFLLNQHNSKLPKIRRTGKSAKINAGKNWIGIQRNKRYNVLDLQSHKLMPGILAAALSLALMMLVWQREGR